MLLKVKNNFRIWSHWASRGAQLAKIREIRSGLVFSDMYSQLKWKNATQIHIIFYKLYYTSSGILRIEPTVHL